MEALTFKQRRDKLINLSRWHHDPGGFTSGAVFPFLSQVARKCG
jgi:hypothetical protein